ncbi:MAG: MBL fold metallo-hydrolase [bacterium]|nr:MBL fold metallo-hydrolase [bacterium]
MPRPLPPWEMRERQLMLLHEIRLHGLPEEADEERYLDQLQPQLQRLVGGNTSCVEVSVGNQTLIFDAGSGIRILGHRLMQGPCGQGQGHLRIFLSHTHWDHIQGYPYFPPIYVPGNRIEIFSGFPNVRQRLEQQQLQDFFPIPVSAFSAEVLYRSLPPGKILELPESEGFPPGTRILVKELNHPGGAYAYRLESQGKSMVYASDAQFSGMDTASLEQYYDFFHSVDVLILDAHFNFRESLIHRDWGHSSALVGVNMAEQSKAKKLLLYHHAPGYSDQMLYELTEEARAYKRMYFAASDLEIDLATEGLTLSLP